VLRNAWWISSKWECGTGPPCTAKEGGWDPAHKLYERLVGTSKVWIQYGLFEAGPIPIPRGERAEDGDEDGEEEEVQIVPGGPIRA
jgi:hypothetical protein